MDQNELMWDKLLKIKTTGRDDSNADQYKYPYEPTPYSVLERLANSGLIRKNNVLLDYGCGKGRVDFFLAYQTRCRAVGIENDERIFKIAVTNQETAISGRKVSFEMQKAIARVMESYYKNHGRCCSFFIIHLTCMSAFS